MVKFAFANLQSQRLHSPSPDHLLLVITQGDSVVAHFDGLPDVGRKFDGHWSEAVQNMRAISPGLADFPSQETALDGAAALLRMAVRFAAGHGGFVGGGDFVSGAVLANLAVLDPDDGGAAPADLVGLMGGGSDGAAEPVAVTH